MSSPLVPPWVVLRDFPYMPLDVVRLRDSDLVSDVSGEGFRCAVLLWCVAWHQVPAASLPNDDTRLAQFAGFGRAVKEWKKHRAEALRGWVLADDGRYYHPTVAEKALEAWEERVKQRWRTECARIKKAGQRNGEPPQYPTLEEFRTTIERGDVAGPVSQDVPSVSPGTTGETGGDVPREMPSKGREGKGRDISIAPDSSSHPAAGAGAGTALVGRFEGHESQPQQRTAPNPVAPLAIALTDAGFGCTPRNPDLIAYHGEGGDVEHLLSIALRAECTGKAVGYVLSWARRELAEQPRAVITGTVTPIHAHTAAPRLSKTAQALVQMQHDAIDHDHR